MKLPARFKWLEEIGVLPKLVKAALDYLDLKEVPGKGSNPVIMNMAKDLDISKIYTDDDISWCALFISWLCHVTGKPMPFKSYDILRAKSFEKWGNPVPKGQEQLGDIVVFQRPGGGHVGILIAVTDKNYVILGGNQSNSVTFTEIAKNRMTAIRRFYATAAPASARLYKMNSSGVLSTNEA